MPAGPRDDRLLWGIALSPVLLLLIAGGLAALRLPVAAAVLVGAVLALGLAVLLARRDGSAPAGWALVPWLYLGLRARRAPGSTWLPALTGLLVWLFCAVTLAPVAQGFDPGGRYDRAKLEAELTAGIRGRTGLPVTVRCPGDQSLANGSAFRCAVAGAGGSTTVEVMVTDAHGGYTWRLD